MLHEHHYEAPKFVTVLLQSIVLLHPRIHLSKGLLDWVEIGGIRREQHRRHDTISPTPGELVTIKDYMGHQGTSVRCIGALSMMIIDRRRGNELQKGKTLFLIQSSNNSVVNDL